MSIFETLRDQVSIEQVTGGRVGEKMPCLAHDDVNTPNLHIYPDHVYCFACGFYGDGVAFWQQKHGFEQPIEAARDLAREFNIKLPERDPQAERRAEEWRAREAELVREAEERHEALEQHPHVREWWRSRGFDEELQKRYLLGASANGKAATIPLWHRGRVQGIILRNLEGRPKYVLPDAEDLPDGRKPLFIPGRVGSDSNVVEGYIDALALDALGESVVAIGGTDPNEGQLRELRRLPGELYILFDNDDAGTEAARKLAEELYPKARICRARYGEGMKDPADLFAAKGEEARKPLEESKRTSVDLIDIETEEAAKQEDPRRRLEYAVEHIVPLVCELDTGISREVALDIAALRLDGVKDKCLRTALKEEQQRRQEEARLRAVKMGSEATAEAQRRYLAKVEAAAEEIAEIFARPGVLDRLQRDAAEMHGLVGDEYAIKMIALIALGAQLKPLPNGRPLGPSVLLTGPPGRGKNYLVDAVARHILPEEFYVAFEISSSQAFYYAVGDDPEFLTHKFVYPNEIEAVDALIEFLRPMLSSGKAVKFTVNKDAMSANAWQEMEVEGPITTALPTVRNKTDEQLHTRLLVGELADYEKRVKKHSAALSEQLLPDHAAADYSHKQFLWCAGLRQLAKRRRVVFPLQHPSFALDNNDLSHGARVWGNILGLMCSHAWLEQRNREKMTLATGEEAIVAEPADYRVAYELFKETCARTVINLSDAHRKILDAVHALEKDEPTSNGFSQHRIADKAGVSQSTVSSNKTFLVTSAKLLMETADGLVLAGGIQPALWEEGDVMKGIPTPEEVEQWWKDRPPPP